MKNGLYTLIGKTVIGEASPAQHREENKVLSWHRRLGHISQQGLLELEKQGLLGKVKLVELSFCEDCVLGKSTRVSFSKATHKTKRTLDYIHSDLWGPAIVNSHRGARYFLTIIDD